MALISREDLKAALNGLAKQTTDTRFCDAYSFYLGALHDAWAEVEKLQMVDWTPVTVALPEEDVVVLVSCRTQKGVNNVNRAYYADGFWHGSGSMSGVKAWMPMPKPYEGE